MKEYKLLLTQRKTPNGQILSWETPVRKHSRYNDGHFLKWAISLLHEKYTTWKRKRITNFDLRKPVRIEIFEDGKVIKVLKQKCFEKTDKVQSKKHVILINNTFYTVVPYSQIDKQKSKKSTKQEEADFNAEKIFNTIEYMATEFPKAKSLEISSAFESNRRAH